jgi:hypothetical protein
VRVGREGDVAAERSFLLTGVADESLNPFLELATGQKHPSAAGEALDADVSAQTHDFPFITTTGMGFAQAHHVAHMHI